MKTAVITGAGTLGPSGLGFECLAQTLASGALHFQPVDRSDEYHRGRGADLVGMIGSVDLKPWLSPAAGRRMSRASRFAVVASHMAREAAGLSPEDVSGPDVAVSLATSFGATSFTEKMLRQVFETGPEAASPFLFMETVANAHAGQIALAHGARGSNTTITQREAGALIALINAAGQIQRGTARIAFAGVSDEMGPLAHSVLDRFGALAQAGDAGPELARAFDLRRNGFLAAEGATVFTIEEEQAARRRDAPILARIRTTVRAFDPSASTTSWGHGEERLGTTLARRLTAPAHPTDRIDRIVSGASGSRAGDRVEARTLRAAWAALDASPSGTPLPPVLAPKALLGEYGGGHLAAALLGLTSDTFAPVPGFSLPDPDLGLEPYAGGSLERAERILVSSMASGGAAAWMILERP